jgi:hypothetical protein
MTAVAVMEQRESTAVQTSVRAMGLLRPIAAPNDVLVAQNETRAMVKEALKQGRDYGTIPGTDKAALLKPGAERLALAFGLAPRFRIVEQEIDHDRDVKWVKRKKVWNNKFKGDKSFVYAEEAGASLGLYRYVVECEMVHRESGTVVAACLGACSSMESKYVDRPRDVENTILKMGEKRAQVGAVILALGLSDEFTQDTEDLAANGVIAANEPTGEVAGGEAAASTDAEPEALCPKCKGKMWDNRAKKTNPKARVVKCRVEECDGVYWPGMWPPKAPDATQTDAFDSSSTNEKLTRDSVFPRGPFANSKVCDLPLDFLKWAVGDERNLGDRTADWQDIFNLEIDERAVVSRDTKGATQKAAEAGPGNAAAALDANAEKPPAREPRPRAAKLALTDEIPF